MALVRQLKKNAAGLSNAKIEDFTIQALVANDPPVKYLLATHKEREYTIRTQSKKLVVEMGFKTRLRTEMRLAQTMKGNKVRSYHTPCTARDVVSTAHTLALCEPGAAGAGAER